MLTLPLTDAERREYRATLGRPHDIKVTVQVLSNDHAILSNISHVLLDGQVDAQTVRRQNGEVDGVGRNVSLSFLDPRQTLSFDANAPTAGAIYMNRMIRVIYSVRVPPKYARQDPGYGSGDYGMGIFGINVPGQILVDPGFWVDVPVFTGPIVKVDRDGPVVNVEAHSKDAFAMGQAYTTATYKGRKADAFMGVMGRSGESSRYIERPATREKLTGPLSVAAETRYWDRAFGLMSSVDRLCYYDGRGVLRTPKRNYKPVATVEAGDDGLLLGEPTVTYSTDDMKNAVWVKGGKPKGSKKAVSARVVAPSSHALSPFNLGRNARPHYRLLVEENTDLRTRAKALSRARSLLRQHLAQEVDVAFDCLPIPHLEPWDVVRVKTDRFSADVPVYRFSLPLTAGGVMTVGHQRRVTSPRARKLTGARR